MRSALVLSLLSFGLGLQSACTSPGGGSSDGPSYDGSADSMESLPDCGPETSGSLFWVKEKNGAFECLKSNEWKQKKNARKPDDVIEEEESGEQEAVTPRIIK